MGTPEYSVPVLEMLIRNFDVVLVVTQPDKKVGRKMILTPCPVKQCAISNNIPVIDQPIEPSVNIGNTNVETFQQPQLTEQNNNSTIKAAVPNIKIALNTIRECENTLMKYGFAVDVEEIDFEDSYQVIFKIEK